MGGRRHRGPPAEDRGRSRSRPRGIVWPGHRRDRDLHQHGEQRRHRPVARPFLTGVEAGFPLDGHAVAVERRPRGEALLAGRLGHAHRRHAESLDLQIDDLDREVGPPGDGGHRRAPEVAPPVVIPGDEEHLMQLPRRRSAVGETPFGVSDQRRIDRAFLTGTPQRREELVGVHGGEVRRGISDQGPHGPPCAFLLDLGQPSAPRRRRRARRRGGKPDTGQVGGRGNPGRLS